MCLEKPCVTASNMKCFIKVYMKKKEEEKEEEEEKKGKVTMGKKWGETNFYLIESIFQVGAF